MVIFWCWGDLSIRGNNPPKNLQKRCTDQRMILEWLENMICSERQESDSNTRELAAPLWLAWLSQTLKFFSEHDTALFFFPLVICSIRNSFTKYFLIISCHLRVLQVYAGTWELCFPALRNFDSFREFPELLIHLISCSGWQYHLKFLQLANAALL